MHRGDVYLDGEAFCEKKTAEEVDRPSAHLVLSGGARAARPSGPTSARPIPTRSSPRSTSARASSCRRKAGLKYITVDGFHFIALRRELAAAESGAANGRDRAAHGQALDHRELQGHQCPVRGHHPRPGAGRGLQRHRRLRRPYRPQQRHPPLRRRRASPARRAPRARLIAGNLIEDTNYRKEFGGWETAAIKFHESVDTVIRGNLIRGVTRRSTARSASGWTWANQGTRITGNIIYDTEAANVFLEMDHGPMLVDNNVLIGQGVRSNSEACVFAHNLLVDCNFDMVSDTERRSQYYQPHTRKEVGRKHGIPAGRQVVQQHFCSSGAGAREKGPRLCCGLQRLSGRRQESSFGDEQSVVDPDVTGLAIEDQPPGSHDHVFDR